MGIGLAAFIDKAGTGPSGNLAKRGGLHGGWESAVVRVHSDGKVTIFSGSHSHGQGHEITFCQIAADRLGLPIDDIRLVEGDTDRDSVRQRHLGRALGLGRRHGDLSRRRQGDRQGARASPRRCMECAPDDIEYRRGVFRVRGTDRQVRFAARRRRRLSRRGAAGGRLARSGPGGHRVLRSARHQRSAGDASRGGHRRSGHRHGEASRFLCAPTTAAS